MFLKRSASRNNGTTKDSNGRGGGGGNSGGADAASIIAEYTTQHRWEELVGHVYRNPEDAKAVLIVMSEKRQPSARIALHEACRYKAPLFAVEALLKVHPSGIRCRDSTYHFLPIHFACRYGSSPDVVQALLEAYPESIVKQDKYGCTPVTLARKSSQQNKEEVLQVLASFSDEVGEDQPRQEPEQRPAPHHTRQTSSPNCSSTGDQQAMSVNSSYCSDDHNNNYTEGEGEAYLPDKPTRRYSYDLHNILNEEGAYASNSGRQNHEGYHSTGSTGRVYNYGRKA